MGRGEGATLTANLNRSDEVNANEFVVAARRLTILPHENADALEIAKIDGTEYQAIVKKGEFKTGDVAVYIPEAAIVPEEILREMGLEGALAGGDIGEDGKKIKNRVKAIRLRGAFSQGLVYKPDILLEEGKDYSEELKIHKWKPPIPTHLAGDVEGAPKIKTYTDIANIKRYPNAFEEGEMVRMSEKLHGCLRANTNILMPDFTRRKISQLVKENYRGDVLGLDANGKVIPTKVLNTFDNGPSKNWLKIRFSRLRIGKGLASSSITATTNHRFYYPSSSKADSEGYVAAGDLEVGDTVSMVRTGAMLTPLSEQVLIGKMLGDGSLARFRNNLETASLHFGHQKKHEEYIHWTLRGLGDLANPVTDERISGYGTKMVRGSSLNSCYVSDLFEEWIQDNHKVVPESAINKIGPIALAFWYMDDGNLSHHDNQEDRANFATQSFNEQSIFNLQNALQRLGMQSVIQKTVKGPRIRLNSDDSEKLFLLIAPYITPCMRYKLPERYRSGSAWLPEHGPNIYKRAIVEQNITEIEILQNNFNRYDLETETHNFFANQVLVHNSCAIISLIDGEVKVSSKGNAKAGRAIRENLSEDGREQNAYWRVAKEYSLGDVLEKIHTKLGLSSHDQVSLYGEVMGVQDLMYGLKKGELDFRAFDIRVNERFLDADEFTRLCEEEEVPTVPVLYEGPYDREKLEEVADGKETFTGNEVHIREGGVVRPIKERTHPEVGRLVLKVISPNYLLRRGDATEFE